MNPAARHRSPDEPARRRGTVEAQAAEWLARRDRGFLPGEQEEFSAWLLGDPQHAAAAKNIEASWRFLQKPRLGGQTAEVLQEIEARVKKRSRRRRLAWASTLGLAAAAAIVIALFPIRFRPAALSVVAGTVQVKPDRQTLPDGSIVELNAGAEIATAFTTSLRSVRLLRGTGLFTVQKDASRPFVVTAGGVSVRAVGTEFCVQFDPNDVDVLVTEGRVSVERRATADDRTTASGEPPPAIVNAGNRVSVSLRDRAAALESRPVAPKAAQAALAWRTMRVEFTDVPLKEIARLFNRSNDTQLEVEPKVADLRISGIYWLDDPEGVSRLIGSSAGLKAIHQGPRSILLRQP